jgi:protein gp37
MGENSNIEWTDHSWSPWRGCTKVSPGCMHCYAETLSYRNPALLGEWGKGKPRVLNKSWNEPAQWNKKPHVCCKCGAQLTQKQGHIIPKSEGRYCGVVDGDGDLDVTFRRPRVFPSLCDWLDEEVPIEWLARFLELIHDTPNIDWLLLTKRPENWDQRLLEAAQYLDKIDGRTVAIRRLAYWRRGIEVPQNVWVGTSVEDQKRADERIPAMLSIPARLRFLSVEPMIGPIEFSDVSGRTDWIQGIGRKALSGIDWVIVGGESGTGARPCNVEWIRSIMKQCAAAKVPVFVKQLGKFVDIHDCEEPNGFSRTCESDEDGRWYAELVHPKGGDPSEWPNDLRVRQYPEVKL